MDYKKLFFSTLAIFGFIFSFDLIVHGHLLVDFYYDTSDLWRNENEYKMGIMLATQLAYALFISMLCGCSVTSVSKCKYANGLIFGLILASLEIAKYSYMPIPFILSMWWCIATIIRGMISWVFAATITSK